MARTTTWPSVRACGICGRERKVQRAAVGGDPDMCQACWKRDQRSWRVCGRCGELRPTQGRDPADAGKMICQRCYRHARPTGTCQECGRVARLARTGARGGPALCGACADRARRPRRECGRCGEVKPVAVREGADDTRDLCFGCYAKTPRRVCGGCGQPAAIKVRGRDGRPDLCARCARPPIARCSVCGREKPCAYTDSGAPLCWSCKPRRIAECAICRRERPVKARSQVGPLCDGCEWRRLRAKATCERCGQRRRPALHPGEQVLCGDCAGIPQTRVCGSCGVEDITYDRGRCPACSLRARLHLWRTDSPPHLIARLEVQFTALERSPNPLSTLVWLATPGGRTLADLAGGRIVLDHEALDGLDRGKSTEDLRAALVHAGVLPPRDEALATLHRWMTGRLAELTPGPDTTTLRAFASWKVTRELAARRARQPGPNALATTMPKRWITAAIALSTWLHAHDRTLVDLDQLLLDAWLTNAPATSRRTVRPFIAWLEHEDRRGLKVPATRAGTAVLALDDHQRLHALRALLDEDAIEPRLRLAGCLIALYAQPVARIVRLTTRDLKVTDTTAQIQLGDAPITLPGPLRDAADQVLAAANPWLFPGQKAGQPRTPRTWPDACASSAFPSPRPAQAHWPPSPTGSPPQSSPTCSASAPRPSAP